jgi:uncharacterized integral membrane protein (TIGR00698 family)
VRRRKRFPSWITLPGAAACVGIALVSVWLAKWFPIIGGPVFAILLGIIIGNVRRPAAVFKTGIAFCSKKVLQLAIVVLGASLSLGQVWKTGRQSLVVMLVSLSAALLAAYFIGRLLKVRPKLVGLVGAGTGICGGSAIAAVAPIVEADDEEIAFAISTVFLFNVVAGVIFPLLGHAMSLSQAGFGLWAGTAINDTSSVVAAAYFYGKDAGDYATVTKLTRTMMIVPICLGLALMVRSKRTTGRYNVGKSLPWFIVGFLIASLMNTAGLFGATGAGWFSSAGKFLITVALAGVGFSAVLKNMIRTGLRPILLGLLVWITVAVTSLGAQWIYGQF